MSAHYSQPLVASGKCDSTLKEDKIILTEDNKEN
jgi:hypothetical protein